jgi:hypothetical protein
VLRPSVIFGVDDHFLNLFAQLQAVAPVFPLAGGDARFQPVWVQDVAQGIVAALMQPQSIGQVIECAGPDVLTLSELVRLSGRWAGVERVQIPLPAAVGRLQAAMMEWLPGEPLMSRDNVDSMRVPNVATGKLPGLQSLGITPAAWPRWRRATWVATRAWRGWMCGAGWPGAIDAGRNGHAATGDRQQELLVLVDAALGADEATRHSLRGTQAAL